MARVRESLQQSLLTILNHLPENFAQYPPEDQLILNKLLQVLNHFKEANYDRKRLAQRMTNLRQEILGSEIYLTTPFYWCIGTFLKNAHLLLLNTFKYHANEFYTYMIHILRGATPKSGIYQLTRRGISFGDFAWEELQYESNRRLISLTDEQIRILEAVYSFITESGIYAMDPTRLRVYLDEQAIISKLHSTPELKRLFALIDARWFFHLYPPAFGLEVLIVRFEIDPSVTIESVIDCNQVRNTTLRTSNVYRVSDQPHSYLGIFLVPDHNIEQLMSYFKRCEENDLLSLAGMAKVQTSQKSASLRLYRANTGWTKPSITMLRRITPELTSQTFQGVQKGPSSLFYPPPFNSRWSFTQHPLPLQIIELYCQIPPNYDYSVLPLISRIRPDRSVKQLTIAEIGLLKQLYYNRVMNVGFVSWYLVQEFSLDYYCLILPSLPLFQLQRFLELLPFSDLFFTPRFILVLTHLTAPLHKWIKNDLGWNVFPITSYYTPITPQIDWFQKHTLQWISPHVLRD